MSLSEPIRVSRTFIGWSQNAMICAVLSVNLYILFPRTVFFIVLLPFRIKLFEKK